MVVEGKTGERRLVAVNYAGNQSQCYVRLPPVGSSVMRFRDLMGPQPSIGMVDDLDARGLYLDMSPWSYHVFEMTAA